MKGAGSGVHDAGTPCPSGSVASAEPANVRSTGADCRRGRSCSSLGAVSIFIFDSPFLRSAILSYPAHHQNWRQRPNTTRSHETLLATQRLLEKRLGGRKICA